MFYQNDNNGSAFVIKTSNYQYDKRVSLRTKNISQNKQAENIKKNKRIISLTVNDLQNKQKSWHGYCSMNGR